MSVVQELFTDRKKLIESLVLIENKDRQLVPFILNPIQSGLYENMSGRDVIVKPAQVGGTSLFICDFLLDCLTIPGTTSVIISYDEFITGRLLRKAQSFYDNLVNRIPGLPQLHHKSVSEKTFLFEDSLGVKRGESSFYIASAKGFAMPRGEPIHNLLLDELAFWPQESKSPTTERGSAVERAFAAALQRVPLLPNTKVIVLSTPNGEDNDFYELYMAAKEGKAIGKSVFKAHFYTWYEMPEYRMSADSQFALPGDDSPILQNLTPEEHTLMFRFQDISFDPVESHDRLRWRRFKIAEAQSLKRTGETRLLFSQEYPEDDVSCFVSAVDQWYDSKMLETLAKMCYPAPVQHLYADIWSPPEEGHIYLLAIDPGVGKTSESVGTVWDITDSTKMKHCATLSGYYAGLEMATKCFPLARYYNNAMIANEDALDITSHLISYPNLYYRTDPVTGKVSNNIGWQTNSSTKVFMCNSLATAMSTMDIHDIRIVQQCKNIREGSSRGRMIPVSVGADDYHDSAAIAVVCRSAFPIERGFVGSKGWSDGWG